MTARSTEASVAYAKYRSELRLPCGDNNPLAAAADAVAREYRDSVKWKMLRCREVSRHDESDNIYILTVDHAIQFDWTWEGAVAFRPKRVAAFLDRTGAEESTRRQIEGEGDASWSGEVIEVDEADGLIFVCIEDPEAAPTTGTFFVRPFEFLYYLNLVFNDASFAGVHETLGGRLAATEGHLHPSVKSAKLVGLPELQQWWSRSWGALWGPPGTGKTYTVGQQVAQVIADPTERILVTSTTNRAADVAALEIGRAAKTHALADLNAGRLLRVGKGVGLRAFQKESLEAMLRGTETEFLAKIEALKNDLNREPRAEAKAIIRKQIKDCRDRMRDAAEEAFLNEGNRVVVSTAYRATSFLDNDWVRESVLSGCAPFTTVIIDEAGLISRAAGAALSLLASRRVLFAGDSRQLAPISRISRVLPAGQMRWLASSALSHLKSLATNEDGVHVLREQRRMHDEVCRAVSTYHYDGALTTAADVASRPSRLPDLFRGHPRPIWYVLDEDGQDLPHIRAERGPGNRSWVRQCTSAVLAKFFTHADVRAARGMFISPFRAQAKAVAAFFASEGLYSWTSSTVHSQQGAEADVVVFDTVNAGSYSWPHDEWKRLINVAVSRAREAVIVLASRAEMAEPYLQPLSGLLAPRVLRRASGRQQFVEVPSKIQYTPTNNTAPAAPHSLGRQIESRKKLRPVMSSEQQRLCGLKLDGGPRLVRGVAGSGKTVVLAHWLAKAMRDMAANPDAVIWVVYANKTLRGLVEDTVRSAWGSDESSGAFPEGRVQFHHIKELLDTLLREAGVRNYDVEFDYNSAAAQYQLCRQGKPADYRCSALYIDEAQDMGPSTLEVLASLVKPMDASQPTKKAVNIFYDNAQNIYRRGTPNWAQLGLDMRGRSAVMRESFRSTLPIAEYALNVLYSFESPESDEDHKELLRRGLVEKTTRRGQDWWSVRYNQVHGPSPVLRTCRNESDQYAAVGDYLCELIEQERVDPADICLLYIGNRAADRIQQDVAQRLHRLDVSLAVRRGESFSRSANEILVTTPHSFKGYDAEVVVIPAANKFYATQRGVLANELYVAMTRARSLVSLFTGDMSSPITAALRQCLDQLEDCPTVDRQVSAWDDYTEMLGIVGDTQSSWLEKVMHSFQIQQEPLPSPDGEILVEPLFWFKHKGKLYVCPHPRRDSGEMRDCVRRHGVEVLEVGQALPV